MNTPSASNEPDPPRLRAISPEWGAFASKASPSKKMVHFAEDEKIKSWIQKAGTSRDPDLDLGAMARAEARLADPNYPDDEVLEIVTRNVILREGL